MTVSTKKVMKERNKETKKIRNRERKKQTTINE